MVNGERVLLLGHPWSKVGAGTTQCLDGRKRSNPDKGGVRGGRQHGVSRIRLKPANQWDVGVPLVSHNLLYSSRGTGEKGTRFPTVRQPAPSR